MAWALYRRILTNRPVRTVLALGVLVRIPTFATNIILTLHVVSQMGKSFAAAGVVSAMSTISLAISNPWRGRLLDRFPLRRVLIPSVVVGGICWSVAPFVGYVGLAALVALSSLFTVPSFSIVRQAVMAAVEEDDRRAALSLDSVMVESAFMMGPALGVWAASMWPTQWVLFGSQMAATCGGILLWVVNPPLRKTEIEAHAHDRTALRSSLMSVPFLTLCAATMAASLILVSTELGVVAAMRSFDAQARTGMALATWGAGSLVGGLVYGSLHRSISPLRLLVILVTVTLPLAAANTVNAVTLLVFVAGLLCAPMIVATIDQVSRVVPDAFRSEALGWHASSMTVGSALGAPVTGAIIDRFGWRMAVVVTCFCGVSVALVAPTMTRVRREV